jgi:hypothetical protein
MNSLTVVNLSQRECQTLKRVGSASVDDHIDAQKRGPY